MAGAVNGADTFPMESKRTNNGWVIICLMECPSRGGRGWCGEWC